MPGQRGSKKKIRAQTFIQPTDVQKQRTSADPCSLLQCYTFLQCSNIRVALPRKLLRSNGWPTSHLWRSIFFSVFVETAFATTLNWKSPIEFMYHRTINFRVVRDQMCSLIIILNTQCTRSKCGRGQIVAFRWFYGWWLGGWPLVFLYRTRNNHHRRGMCDVCAQCMGSIWFYYFYDLNRRHSVHSNTCAKRTETILYKHQIYSIKFE